MEETTDIRHTCLHSAHEALGAHMAPFAGFDMPIEYPAGLDAEHRAVREDCGVFDVSHMGEVLVTGPRAAEFVNRIFSNDISAIPDGKILYGMMLNHQGGIVDDLLVYRMASDRFFLVINAANIAKDLEWIRACAAEFGTGVEVTDQSDVYAQLALQGPEAADALESLTSLSGSDLTFYTFKTIPGGTPDAPAILSRTGYTGEDGFEIYAPAPMIISMWKGLIDCGVQPCGLGCRDTLRFEAGLPLYGNELADDISPLEAGLSMFVKLDKEGGFIGREALEEQKARGLSRKSVGLKIDSPATARHGFEVLDMEGNVIGHVTTGYRAISVDGNFAVALVDSRFAAPGTQLQVRIRRKTAPAVVVKRRFYTPKYKK